MIVGASVSFTVTVNEHVAVLLEASVTVKLFVVVPTGKVEPLARPPVCDTVWPGQLSEEPTVYVTDAPHIPLSFDTVIFAGQLIVGASVSFTVTVNEHVAVLLEASVTVKLFVVVPVGNVEPLAWPAVCATVSPVQLSSELTV